MQKTDGKNKFDTAVVGGGASGMVAACFCALSGKKVCILEKNKKVGRKLSVTGNGKCNLTNFAMGPEYYYSGDGLKEAGFVERLLAEYGTVDILDLFRNIGIICKEKNGYLYPISEQAQSVTGALEAELDRLGITVFFEADVKDVSSLSDGTFAIDAGVKVYAEKLILACGGPAAPVYGSSAFGFDYLRKTGHKVTEPMPALCPLTVSERFIKQLAGVRLEAEVELITGNSEYFEKGEIIFNADNVSGIPVFQLSRFVSRYKDKVPGNVQLKLDLIPELTANELIDSVMQLSQRNPGLSVEYLFRGVLNYKAVYYILKEKGFDPEKSVKGLERKTAGKLVSCFKNLVLSVTGTKGFENSQVCTGGLSISEINESTLESKRVKGLFVTGELLDVDGKCGGYNLHFAFSTGMRAGKAAGMLSSGAYKTGSVGGNV